MTSSAGTTTVSSDIEAIRGVIDAYAQSMRAADVEAIVELYTDDAVVLGPDMEVATGRTQLADVYRGALGAVAMDFTFSFDEVTIRGDTAVARTRTDGTNTVRASGDEIPCRYRELFVLYRLPGGWKIARYMFQPQPTAPESSDGGEAR